MYEKMNLSPPFPEGIHGQELRKRQKEQTISRTSNREALIESTTTPSNHSRESKGP